MIVGEGCAGKTAFANSIIGTKYEETESTVGINTFMCSVTHAALSKSEWIKCDKIEKEYENAIAEHLSFTKVADNEEVQQEFSQIDRKKDRNGLDTRVADNLSAFKSDGTTLAHSKDGEQEEDGAALDHSKNDSTTDGIDQFSNADVDEDMIVKYLANHVEIGANILISIFDYGGQSVFNVSVMFIYITIILFAVNTINHITVF